MIATALLNWRVWAAILLATALAASHWKAYTAGRKNVQAAWTLEQLATAQSHAQQLAEAASTTASLQAKADTQRKAKNAQIDRLNAELADALVSLHNRPTRPTGDSVPSDPAAGPAPGCTGAQLYRADAEFLVRESARGERLRADLAECQAAYSEAREALTR